MTISGVDFEKNITATYVQDGELIRIKLFEEILYGFYDGESLKIDAEIYGEITYIVKCDF